MPRLQMYIVPLLTGLIIVGGATPSSSETPRLDVQGHRGCRGLLPESTLAGFERAIELGVTTLELDLQVTLDRAVIVSHDPRLEPQRCLMDGESGLGRPLFEELRLADILGAECGARQAAGFPEQETLRGAGIPTLAEVLELANEAPYPVRLALEIKEQGVRRNVDLEEFTTLVVELVKEHDLSSRTTIASFEPRALQVARGLDDEIDLAILLRRWRGVAAAIAETSPTIVSLKSSHLKAGRTEQLQMLGLQVMPWGANTLQEMARLIDEGVDGIITDYPDRLLTLCQERGLETRPENIDLTLPDTGGLQGAVSERSSLVRGREKPGQAMIAASPVPARPPAPALSMRDIRTVAVVPTTSRGLVDTFGTSLLIAELERSASRFVVIDPYQLPVPFVDGTAFNAATQLRPILDAARDLGADAVLVGVGLWYSNETRFRMELRLIEVNEGRVLWKNARASGFGWTGPAMKKRVMRRLVSTLRSKRS